YVWPQFCAPLRAFHGIGGAERALRPHPRTERRAIRARFLVERFIHRDSRVGDFQIFGARSPTPGAKVLTPCVVRTEGRRYERPIAEAARNGRAGPGFSAGPQDGRSRGRTRAREARGAGAARGGTRGSATGGSDEDPSGDQAPQGG